MKILNSVVCAAPKFLGALSLLAGLSFSMGAQASAPVVDLGTLTAGTTSFDGAHLFGVDFSDNFTFKLAGASDVHTTVENFVVSVGSWNLVNISGLKLKLFDSANHLITDQLNTYSFNLAGGNYFANISGKSDGLSFGAGLYKLSLNVANTNIPAVPEAETYAMLLAGLGVIGFISRRRQKTATSIFA